MIPTQLQKKAFDLGADEFGTSWRKHKRFFVRYHGKYIHFGSNNGKTFFDHKDDKKRLAWQKRHSKIKLNNGTLAYRVKESPAFWSWNVLW